MIPKPHLYILEGRVPKPVRNAVHWAKQHALADRQVGHTQIGRATVSTVFTGIANRFTPDGSPRLFETTVLGARGARDSMHCATWAEAEDQHALICRTLKTEMDGP